MTIVSYTNEENLITRQNKAEKAFMAEFEQGEFTLETPLVIQNPYLINPLCALVLFKTDTPAAATVTICGKRWEVEDISHTFEAATTHVLPVLGLYEDHENRVKIALETGEQKELVIETGPLEMDVCRCQNISTSLDYMKDNIMFLTPAGKNLPMGYDYAGDIRWLLTINTMFDIKRLANGNIMTGSHRYYYMPYNATGLYELNLLGKIYRETRMPGGYHHDHFEMEDGNILALTQDFGPESTTCEDICVLMDRKTGEVLKSWDYKTFLPQDVAGSGSQDAHDWFHNNAVWYDKKTHSLTLSGRHQDAVVNIDYESGKLNWILGDPEGWPKEMVDKYFFTPVGDVENFDWQYEQHACVVTPEGDIMMFDNGQYRSKIKENYLPNQKNFSRGVRYRIDTENMEIEQVWQYGKERGQRFFSPYICNVEYYADGHYMIHSGGIGIENGQASDKLAAFFDPANKEQVSRSITVEEKNGVVLYELEVEGNFYRGEKLPLYHGQNNCVLGEGETSGMLEQTPEFDTLPDVPEVAALLDAWHEIRIEEEEDRFVFHGKFEKGTLVMVCLEGTTSHQYFINTAATFHLAMCSGAFLENDERDVKKNISKRGLEGAFDIKLIINDTKYQTGVRIFC